MPQLLLPVRRCFRKIVTFPTPIHRRPFWFYTPFYLLAWSLSHNVWTLFNMGCVVALGLASCLTSSVQRLPRVALPLWLAALCLSGPPYAVAFYGRADVSLLLSLVLAWRFLARTDRFP